MFTSISALGDNLFFSNATDGLKHYNLTSVVIDSSALNFSQIVTHKGRLWGIGRSSDTRTIYGSEYLDGTNFALAVDPVDTDPVRIEVQGKLDEILTVLFPSYKDKLVWYKGTSFGGISGSRLSPSAVPA